MPTKKVTRPALVSKPADVLSFRRSLKNMEKDLLVQFRRLPAFQREDVLTYMRAVQDEDFIERLAMAVARKIEERWEA